MSGPLSGVRVVEMSALGPAPYGVMLLADLGADVVRIDRASGGQVQVGFEATMVGLSRNRRSIAVDLKTEAGTDVVLRLIDEADVVVEGWRPGVAERLGLGPDDLLARNPRLVYARATGWGQDGPLAPTAGHDIGYAALAGTLHTVGRAGEPPPPPVNYLADFGGGGTFLAIGVLAALVERDRSGEGQVVDTAMVDGAASQTAFVHGLLAMGGWTDEREANLLDGAAPFYDTYTCADGRFLAVGAIEPQFFAALCEGLGVDPADFPQQDRASWPDQKGRIAAIIATRTRDEWAEVFDGTDACVAPVLSLTEAPEHPHNVAREAFVEVAGSPQPAPAPRFSRTPGAVRVPAPRHGADTDAVLTELGLDAEAIAELRSTGAVAG
ncbi:CaiB/BaiF CoA transferase family protein [Nitriliruptor alkaliphilus]|uniref:CaiB/BaiF CoA transferase family protein n=1 Tax=Nitriliruptor alkaliphilus TaxID=427918 RepID=UPI000A691003|nr:CaiB/BaiF CoA-transferase family protein [Nitriliruptor alkaliphilus]